MPRRQTNETVSIHAEWWDADEQVEILVNLTHGMKKQIEASVMAYMDTSKFDPSVPETIKTVKVDMKQAMAAGDDVKNLLFIKSWTLKNADGSIMVIDQESLDSLAEEDAAFINAEIDKRDTSKVTEEQRAAFLLKQGSGMETATASSTLLPGG